jgi:hypothetical protein
MSKGRWFDLRDLPGYITALEEKSGIITKEYHFISSGKKSNIELVFPKALSDKEVRSLIEDFIKSKNKKGLEILKESDFFQDEKDPRGFEFRYKDYSVLVTFMNDTELKPRKVYVSCQKYPI